MLASAGAISALAVSVQADQSVAWSEQIALEGQDLPRTYLAHHELESVIVIIIKALPGGTCFSQHACCGPCVTACQLPDLMLIDPTLVCACSKQHLRVSSSVLRFDLNVHRV